MCTYDSWSTCTKITFMMMMINFLINDDFFFPFSHPWGHHMYFSHSSATTLPQLMKSKRYKKMMMIMVAEFKQVSCTSLVLPPWWSVLLCFGLLFWFYYSPIVTTRLAFIHNRVTKVTKVTYPIPSLAFALALPM